MNKGFICEEVIKFCGDGFPHDMPYRYAGYAIASDGVTMIAAPLQRFKKLRKIGYIEAWEWIKKFFKNQSIDDNYGSLNIEYALGVCDSCIEKGVPLSLVYHKFDAKHIQKVLFSARNFASTLRIRQIPNLSKDRVLVLSTSELFEEQPIYYYIVPLVVKEVQNENQS